MILTSFINRMGFKMSPVYHATILRSYLRGLKRAREERPCCTAGELAKRMGVSRTTAQKYLRELVAMGQVAEYDFTHVNGMTCTAYMPTRAGA